MFPTSIFARFAILLSLIAAGGCANIPSNSPADPQAAVSAVIVAEIAASRNELVLAARQYGVIAAGSDDIAVLERATRLAADAQQPTLALRAARRWIRRDRASANAQLAAGLAALELHEVADSAGFFRAALSLNTGGVDAAFGEFETLFAESDNVYGARQVAELLTAPYAASAGALRFLGIAQANADNAQAAADTFRKYLALTPAQDAVWIRARALAATDKGAEALAVANAQVDAHGDESNRLEHASLLIMLHREGAAQAELESLLDSEESKPRALRLMGQLQLQLGNLDAAEICFTQLLKSGHFVEDTFYFLGRVHERRHQDDDALRSYARVTAGDNVLSAMLHAAALLRRSGAAVEADQLLDGLIADAPTRAPQIISARAQLYADAHENLRALQSLDAGIAEYPDSVDLRYKRAEILEQTQRFDAALAELSALERRRPNDPAAMNALGYTLADHSLQLRRARSLIERAFAQAPQNAAIRDSLGWVLFRQGLGEQALPHLTAAFASDRGAETGAHLGEVLWILNQRAQARGVWEKARAVDPDDRVLRATLARLEGAH